MVEFSSPRDVLKAENIANDKARFEFTDYTTGGGREPELIENLTENDRLIALAYDNSGKGTYVEGWMDLSKTEEENAPEAIEEHYLDENYKGAELGEHGEPDLDENSYSVRYNIMILGPIGWDNKEEESKGRIETESEDSQIIMEAELEPDIVDELEN